MRQLTEKIVFDKTVFSCVLDRAHRSNRHRGAVHISVRCELPMGAPEKKGDVLLGGGADDLFAMMGMKRFSVLDKGDGEEPKDDDPANGALVLLRLEPVSDGSVRLTLSINAVA